MMAKNNQDPRTQLQQVPAPGLILQRDEACFCAVDAFLLENIVTRRRISGGSVGLSHKLTKKTTIRASRFQGEIVPEKRLVPTNVGMFFLTNHRAVFRGNEKSLNMKLTSILSVEMFADGLRITDAKGKPRLIRIEDQKELAEVKAVLEALFYQGGE